MNLILPNIKIMSVPSPLLTSLASFYHAGELEYSGKGKGERRVKVGNEMAEWMVIMRNLTMFWSF